MTAAALAPEPVHDDYLVTVCDACLRASCWHWEFPCERGRTAGTRLMKASDLRRLAKESEGHYSPERLIEVCGITLAESLP